MKYGDGNTTSTSPNNFNFFFHMRFTFNKQTLTNYKYKRQLHAVLQRTRQQSKVGCPFVDLFRLNAPYYSRRSCRCGKAFLKLRCARDWQDVVLLAKRLQFRHLLLIC